MINILHPQRDEMIGSIDTADYFEGEHIQGLDGEHTIQFTVLADSEEAALLTDRCRLLRQTKRGDWQEFIAYQIITVSERFKTVIATGAEADLDRLKVMEPKWREGYTLETYITEAIGGTGYQIGDIDYGISKSRNFESHTGAYEFLRRVAELYERELRFRIVVSGRRVIGRYVDIVERIGADNREELVVGDNIPGIRRIVRSDDIVTALYCIGPERSDGTRLTAMVTDEDAFQRWNWNGNHIIHFYEPQSSSADMTLTQLQQYGRTELNKQIKAITDYEVSVELLPDQDISIGDTLRIKDESVNPPLYATSRAIKVVEPIDYKQSGQRFTFGEVKEMNKDDVMARLIENQKRFSTRIIKSEVPPVGSSNVIWMKTDPTKEFDVAHTWDGAKWVASTPTTAAQVGAASTAEITTAVQNLEIGARNLLIAKNITKGVYLKSDGTTAANVESFTSDFIDISRATDVIFSTNGRNKYKQLAFYNQQKVFMPPLIEYNSLDKDFITAKRPDGAVWSRVSSDLYADGFFKLEKGTKVTGWTPAPEDVEANALAVSATAEKNAKEFATAAAGTAEKNAKDFVVSYAGKKVTKGAQPASPGIDDLWIDDTSGESIWKRWNGTAWELAIKVTTNMISALGIDAGVLKAGTVIAENIIFKGQLSGASGVFSGAVTVTGLSTFGNINTINIENGKFTTASNTGQMEISDAIIRSTNSNGSDMYLNSQNVQFRNTQTGTSSVVRYGSTNVNGVLKGSIDATEDMTIYTGRYVDLFTDGQKDRATFGFKNVESFRHAAMVAGNGMMKSLNGGTSQFQFRNREDTAYVPVVASNVSVSSHPKFKKNISEYKENVLAKLLKHPVQQYNMADDKPGKAKTIGYRSDNAPAEVVDEDGETINLYATTMLPIKGLTELVQLLIKNGTIDSKDIN